MFNSFVNNILKICFLLMATCSVWAKDRLSRIGGATAFGFPVTEASLYLEQQERETRQNAYRQSISNLIIYNKLEREKREKMIPILEERTVRFLKERTTNGSPEASFDLYERYKTGKGVIQDNEEALRYLKMSAEFGNARAKKLLGLGTPAKLETNSLPILPNTK
jgi:TPR repeat protein